jgi:hypothetical protein
MTAVDLSAVLSAGRVAAESRMTDTCTIGDPQAGNGPWNPTTEQYDPDPSAAVYTGKCRVKMPRSMAIEPDAGETTGVVIRPEIHIPADVVGVAVGHRVTVTSAEFNPTLADVVFRVTSLFRDSQATAQRLECTEDQS